MRLVGKAIGSKAGGDRAQELTAAMSAVIDQIRQRKQPLTEISKSADLMFVKWIRKDR